MKTKRRKFVHITLRQLEQQHKDEAKLQARLKAMDFTDLRDPASVSNAAYRREQDRIVLAQRDDAAFMRSIGV